MSRREEMIHPKISAIQEHLNIIDRLIRLGDYLPALKEMYLTTIEMKPSDRPKPLMAKIKQEILALTHATPGTQRRNYSDKEWDYIDYTTELSDTIWTAKYFDNNKYGNSRSLKELRQLVGDNRPVEGDEENDDE